MKWTMRLERSRFDEIRLDLERRHDFAAERVGFLLVKMGNRESSSERIIFGVDYWPVPDGDYIDDPSVGARYSATVHRRIFERSMSESVGVFHVHMHEHYGSPGFSHIDLECIRKLVPSLRTVQPSMAHGALVLSRNSLTALCWLPESSEPAANGRVSVVGWPLRVFPMELDHEL